MNGLGGSQGVIQVHADLAQWLSDDVECDEQQHEQTAQWEEQAENHSHDESHHAILAAADAKSGTPTSPHSTAATSVASFVQPSRQNRSSVAKASQSAALATVTTKASKLRKRASPAFQPKTRKAIFYADRYAETVGLKGVGEAVVTGEQAVHSTQTDGVAQLAASVDILVIAPFTADGTRPPSPPPCVDEAELAARYPDYFNDEAAITYEYEQSDPSVSFDDLRSHTIPPTAAALSPPSYQPYTMSDFRTLPKEVKLGRLGASVDPVDVEARERKRREMKELERQVREENRRRMERADKQRVAAIRAKAVQSDAVALSTPVVQVREEKQQEEGQNGPTAEPATASPASVGCESKDGGHSEENKQAEDGKVRSVRRAGVGKMKRVDRSSGKVNVKRVAEKADEVSRLLSEQEKERQKVTHIRQSLGLK